jgi:uncharacterized membrane protein
MEICGPAEFGFGSEGQQQRVSFDEVVELVGKTIDGIGVLILAAGSVMVLVGYGYKTITRKSAETTYGEVRPRLGRVILLGLEFLVAGDIIRTVATTPTFSGVGVLAIIVLIRTFLSFALEVELEGTWPWQRRGAAPSSQS